MSVNNQNAINYVKQVNESLLIVCSPLMDNFPVNGFFYVEYRSPEEYFFLCNNIAWSEVHLSMPHNGVIFEEWVRNSQQHDGLSVVSWSSLGLNDHVMKRAIEYQFISGLNFYQNTGGVVKVWSFASCYNEAMIFFQNNKDIFKHFIEYFNNSSQSFMTTEARQKACARWEVPLKFDLQLSDEEERARQRFFEMTSLSSKNKEIVWGKNSFELTPHQWKHLELYAKGHSMKEMANMLNISPRTVEAILNTIRYRSGLSSKSALRQLYERNNFLESIA